MFRHATTIVIALVSVAEAGPNEAAVGAPIVIDDPPALAADAQVDPEVLALVGRRTLEAKAKPRDAEARRVLAMTFHANGLARLAAVTYEQAIDLNPRCARCWNNLAIVRAEEDADLSAAIASADRAIAIDARYVPIRVRRGVWLFDLGRIDEAANALGEVLTIDPANVAAHVGLAKIDLARNNAAAALARMEATAKQVPAATQNIGFRRTLGIAYARLGRAEHARGVLGTVADATPTMDDPWLNEISAHRAGYRARMTDAANLIARNELDRAIALLDQIRSLKPNDADATVLLAQARLAKGETAAAQTLLQAMLAQIPNSYDATMVQASIFQALGDTASAMNFAQRAVTIDPGRGQAWALLGRLHADAGRFTEAVDALDKSVACGNDDPSVLIARGRLMLQIGDVVGSRRAFEQLTYAQPFLGAGFVGLAMACAESGDLPTATAALNRGRQLDPNDPMLTQAAARINAPQGASP